jgi:hypothetical protein
MDNRDISLYLSRILSGFYIFCHNNTNFKLVYPDINIKYEAELYAQQEYQNNKYNDWISEDDILNVLINIGLWTPDGDTKLKSLEKSIEDIKVDIYKNYINQPKLKSLRKTLANYKKNYHRQYEARHCLDHITADGYSQILKNQYILINSIFDINDKKIFQNLENTDFNLLSSLSSTIMHDNIDISVFRKIAQSDIWRNYWSANKDRVFDKSVIDWTDEQRTLVIITKMYDSAHEHPECPPDNIIADDDAFDGWMLMQKRENEKARSKKRTESMLGGKLSKAGEVFLMARNKEEAEGIYNLNDPASLNTIKERNTIIGKSDSDIPEAKLPDVQRNLQIQRNQIMMKRK